MAETIEDNGYFQTKLAEFNEKFAEFQRVLALLSTTPSRDPQLEAERQELLGRAHWIETIIAKAKEAINWANMQIRQLSDSLSGNLGLLPVVAIAAAVAAIVGAIAYMSAWISDAYSWSKKADIAQSMERAGGSPTDIQRAIAEQNGIGTIAIIGLLAVAGIGLWLSQNRG